MTLEEFHRTMLPLVASGDPLEEVTFTLKRYDLQTLALGCYAVRDALGGLNQNNLYGNPVADVVLVVPRHDLVAMLGVVEGCIQVSGAARVGRDTAVPTWQCGPVWQPALQIEESLSNLVKGTAA